MSKQLTNDELGKISYLIGKHNVPAEYKAGYDAAKAAEQAKATEQAAQMAEYNRLAATGLTDKEIEKLLKQ